MEALKVLREMNEELQVELDGIEKKIAELLQPKLVANPGKTMEQIIESMGNSILALKPSLNVNIITRRIAVSYGPPQPLAVDRYHQYGAETNLFDDVLGPFAARFGLPLGDLKLLMRSLARKSAILDNMLSNDKLYAQYSKKVDK